MKALFLSIVFILTGCVAVHAQTIVVPAGGNLQSAIEAARCGNRILLEPGATYTGNFNLGPKPACTGTDADYITITTSDPTGIPANLTNYPHSDTPTTTAAAARMPKVVTPNSYPAFWLNGGAKYWRIKGLNITSVVGARAIRLIGFGEVIPADRAQYPDRIIIEQNWIHPPEEDGTPLSNANMLRSVDNGIYFEGTNSIIQQNDLGAFVGRYADSNDPMTTAGILITTWADNVVIQNNYIRAWTYAFFFGGGSKGFATVTATVTNCTTTSCQFSSTAGITVGKAIAVLVYKAGDSSGVEREWWGQGFVSSINGSTVTVSKPWCHSNNDPNGNTCLPFTSANLRQFPADGTVARIEGLQPQNIIVRRNYISKRPEWKTLLGQSGGKGYFEMKACHNCVVDGNIFDHGTGSTITTRNQGGADPWNDLDGLRYTNNWSKRCNAVFTGYLQDGANLTNRTQGVLFENNLCVGPMGEPAGWEWMLITSNVLSGADNVTIRNNTELIARYRNYTSYADAPIRGMINQNNIHRASGGACFTTGAGESGSPWSACWPGANVSGNVLVNIDNNPVDDIRNAWVTPYPNGNNTITTLAGVGFVDPTLDALGNYRVKQDSPFFGKGADIDKMNAAIFGSGPVPVPTPMPSVSPTPAASPLPSPTPQPTPVASPSPVPTTFTWEKVPGSPEGAQTLAFIGPTLYVGTRGKGVFAYDGQTWTAVNEGLPATPGWVGNFFVTRAGSLLASMRFANQLRSETYRLSGGVWAQSSNAGNEYATFYASDRDGNILASTNTATVLISTDDGKTFARLSDVPPVNGVSSSSFSIGNGLNDVIYLHSHDTGSFYSNDGGKTWIYMPGDRSGPFGNQTALLSNARGEMIAASGFGGIYRNRGTLQSPSIQLETNLQTNNDAGAHSLIRLTDGTLVSHFIRLFCSKDGGDNWSACDSGIQSGTTTGSQNIQSLHTGDLAQGPDGRVYVGFLNAGFGIYRTVVGSVPPPSPSPTPIGTPVPTPTPVTGISISGRVVDQNDNSVEGALVSAFNRTVLSRKDDGYFELDNIPVGAEVRAEKSGYAFVPVTVTRDQLEQHYFLKGRVVTQPSPTPTPIVTPTPTPQPTPQPTPSPTPVPTPSPTPIPLPPPSPTPTPAPVCSMSVPASITLARNSSTTITISISAEATPLPIAVSAIATTGQVTVSPFRRVATTNNAPLLFTVRSKNNPSSVRFESPCGIKITNVLVR